MNLENWTNKIAFYFSNKTWWAIHINSQDITMNSGLHWQTKNEPPTISHTWLKVKRLLNLLTNSYFLLIPCMLSLLKVMVSFLKLSDSYSYAFTYTRKAGVVEPEGQGYKKTTRQKDKPNKTYSFINIKERESSHRELKPHSLALLNTVYIFNKAIKNR